MEDMEIGIGNLDDGERRLLDDGRKTLSFMCKKLKKMAKESDK